MSDPEILVRGHDTCEVAPDTMAVRIGVKQIHARRDKALDLVARTRDAVAAVLDGRQDAIRSQATLGVDVRGRYESGRKERMPRAFVASQTLRVVFENFDVGRELGEIAAIDGVSLQGPEWAVDDDNEAYDGVRRRAAADARARASSYTDALDMELERLLWLAEPGLRRDPVRTGDVAMAPVAAPAPAAAGAPDQDEIAEIDLTPRDIVVSATVEAAFTASRRKRTRAE